MNRELYFPTPVYVKDINDLTLNKQLERDIITWSNQDKGVQRTNMNGWHSTTDTPKTPKPLINVIIKI